MTAGPAAAGVTRRLAFSQVTVEFLATNECAGLEKPFELAELAATTARIRSATPEPAWLSLRPGVCQADASPSPGTLPA